MVTTYYAKWLLKNNPPNLTTQKPNCASPNSIPCYVIMGDEKNTENIYIYKYIYMSSFNWIITGKISDS